MKNRYFIVCWVGLNTSTGLKETSHDVFETEGLYINENTLFGMVNESYGHDSIAITNIIELSKQDYIEFIRINNQTK